MKVSVIVPTYNEERLLPRCLESLVAQPPGVSCEIIVTDGGSSDSTLRVAERYTQLLIRRDRPNLAQQLNAAAAAATGDTLLFLHADTTLPANALPHLAALPQDIVGGAFTMQVSGDRTFYRVLSWGGNAFCRLTRIYFGDRGMFVRARVFQQMDGFADLPIMTDVDFSKRLRRHGKTVLLPGPLRSSGRKFDHERPWRTLYLIFYALMAFELGVDPQRIKAKYYGAKRGEPGGSRSG